MSLSPAQRVLFVVGGFGLGNATRCEALIHEWRKRGFVVDVAASGNSLWYLSDTTDAGLRISLAPVSYGVSGDGISLLRTFLGAPGLLASIARNAIRLWRKHREEHYSLIVVDSEYSVLAFKFLFQAPVVALNNVFFTAELWRRFPRLMPGARSMKIVERVDHFVQSKLSDACVSPVFDQGLLGTNGKVHFCPPLVRSEFRQSDLPQKLGHALVVFSGSGLGASPRLIDELLAIDELQHVTVVGMDGQSTPRLTFLGKTKHFAEAMEQADFVVGAGGCSTISEALVARRPLMVIPLPDHFEQALNAHSIERAHFGVVAKMGAVARAYENLSALVETESWQTAGFGADGAAGVVDFIQSRFPELKAVEPDLAFGQQFAELG